MMEPLSTARFDAVEIPGIPASLWPLLQRAAAGDRLAVVGGAVRDLLLHTVHRDPWRGLTDLDLVVDGGEGATPDAEGCDPQAAQRLGQALGRQLGPASLKLQEHGAYGTVEMELQLAEGPLLLDLATARLEHYPLAAENPVVQAGRLEDDLARRDFSINAMALVLTPNPLKSSGAIPAAQIFWLARRWPCSIPMAGRPTWPTGSCASCTPAVCATIRPA